MNRSSHFDGVARTTPFTGDDGLLDAVPTPSLLVDVDRVQSNIERMMVATHTMGVGLRPHAKAHKATEIARRQVDAGAVGITVATVDEATAMVRAGIDDVMIANQVVAPAGIERLAALARSAHVMVLVDDRDNVAQLAAAARRLGVVIDVLVEVDIGMRRAGVRAAGEALALVELVGSHPGLAWRGLHGYEGHCSDDPDRTRRDRRTTEALDVLGEVADVARSGGLHSEIVSAGATGTYVTAGGHSAVTEIQPGSYVCMDRFHAPLIDEFEFAIAVATTAISVHGSSVVFDAGRKSIGADLCRPLAPPGGHIDFVHEEHLGVSFAGPSPFRVGDRTTMVPGYAPSAVNLLGVYHVVEQHRLLEGRWTACARHGG